MFSALVLSTIHFVLRWSRGRQWWRMLRRRWVGNGEMQRQWQWQNAMAMDFCIIHWILSWYWYWIHKLLCIAWNVLLFNNSDKTPRAANVFSGEQRRWWPSRHFHGGTWVSRFFLSSAIFIFMGQHECWDFYPRQGHFLKVSGWVDYFLRRIMSNATTVTKSRCWQKFNPCSNSGEVLLTNLDHVDRVL